MADEKYIKVMKSGRVLEVHPDMLQHHLKLGFVQMPDEDESKAKKYSKAELDKAVKEAVEKALAERDAATAEQAEPAAEKKK